MYYEFNEKNRIEVPDPFHRYLTPIFMGDESEESKECGFSVHMTEFPKGGKVDHHIHGDATEVMFCVSGTGKFYLEGKEYDFAPGSLVAAPPGVWHEIINDGDELLRVLCIYNPPYTATQIVERAKDAVKNAK